MIQYIWIEPESAVEYEMRGKPYEFDDARNERGLIEDKIAALQLVLFIKTSIHFNELFDFTKIEDWKLKNFLNSFHFESFN